MNSIARAQAARRLGEDPTFREVIEEVRQDQAKIFLRSTASSEEREDAHAIVRALDKIEAKIREAKNTLSVAKHTGQHRESD